MLTTVYFLIFTFQSRLHFGIVPPIFIVDEIEAYKGYISYSVLQINQSQDSNLAVIPTSMFLTE